MFDSEAGVNVVDMSDPAEPEVTDSLVTPAMLSPHESLVVNKKRGLLAAVLGNPPSIRGWSTSTTSRPTAATPCSGRRRRSASSATRAHVPRREHVLLGVTGQLDALRDRHLEPLAADAAWLGPYDSHGLSIRTTATAPTSPAQARG